MRIVYFGTPEYSCIPLKALIDKGYEISLVVTRADKPRGRGNKLCPCPVKELAQSLNIPVISPDRIKDNKEVYEAIKNADPDFIVVYSYGRIIPKEILDLPKYETLNIHGSLLPKYRGAAPIQRSVQNGDYKTGITIMRMEEGLDTGAMYINCTVYIQRKTSAELFTELSKIGSDVLLAVIPEIVAGKITPVPQNEEESCYASLISKEEAFIDWNKSAKEIDCLVRAFNDEPVARTLRNGEVLKIYRTEVLKGNGKPGTVLCADKHGIEVACGDGSVLITSLQAPGKKIMDAGAYLLGNKIETGEIFG